MDWLSDRGFPFSGKMREPELYNLIKLYKPRFKTFKIDVLLAERGHSVLLLLTYHPDLNQTELIWRLVKDYVAREKFSFSPDYAMKLAEENFNIIAKEKWSSRYNNARGSRTELFATGPHY